MSSRLFDNTDMFLGVQFSPQISIVSGMVMSPLGVISITPFSEFPNISPPIFRVGLHSKRMIDSNVLMDIRSLSFIHMSYS